METASRILIMEIENQMDKLGISHRNRAYTGALEDCVQGPFLLHQDFGA